MSDYKALLQNQEKEILRLWLDKLAATTSRFQKMLSPQERESYSREFLEGFLGLLGQDASFDIEDAHFKTLRTLLARFSTDFAERELTPSETATYIFSLKEVVFHVLQQHLSSDALLQAVWQTGSIIDKLGLYSFESFNLARERIVKSQAQALSELSTPVIQVWQGVIALPLVGAIDSIRAKEVMEKLLDAVVEEEADIVIIDITGVPVVDTQVANRLMRTVESVRLLGAASIITGVNPVIAQTLVQLGVDLSQLTTKASLRAGLQQAFRHLNLKVMSAKGN